MIVHRIVKDKCARVRPSASRSQRNAGAGNQSRFLRLAAFLACALLLALPGNAATLLTTLGVGSKPVQVVVNSSAHLAYVVNEGSNSVSVIDTETLKVTKTLTVGTGPIAIATNPAAGLVYVGNSTAGTISPIKTTTVQAAWNVGGTPAALAVDGALGEVYVMDTARNQIEILDDTKGTLLKTISTSLPPTAMAVNVVAHTLFVACSGGSGSVVVIDGAQKQIVTTIPVATGTTSISVDPITNVAVAVSPTANLHTTIQAGNGFAVSTQTGDSGAKPFATAYDSSLPNGLFLQADTGDGNVFFSDGSGEVTLGDAYFTGFQGANGLAISPSTNQMVVVLGGTDAVILVDLLNPLFPSNYHILNSGLGVAGVAFDPIGSKLFITNMADGTVCVYDISPRELVDAYEGSFDGNSINFNYIDSNPATGMVYTLRLGTLFAINEAAAGAGADGTRQNPAGVTAIPLGTINLGSVAVNVATNKIYAGINAGATYVVDGQTNVATPLTSIPSSANIGAIAVDYATNEILEWDSITGNLFVLDGSTNALLHTVLTGFAEFASLVVDPVHNLGYLGGVNAVYVVDPAAGALVTKITLGGQVFAEAINTDANRLYVLDGSKKLTVIDTSTHSVVTTVSLPFSQMESLAVNPNSGNYYIGMGDGNGVTHVYEMSGKKNKLVTDFSEKTIPALTGAASLCVNPLTNVVYVGSVFNTSASVVAAIDEQSGTVTAIPPLYDGAAQAMTLDMGTGVLAAAGYSYTNLFFPTSGVSGKDSVPIAVTGKGVQDAQTIATSPLFRTHNVKPSFKVTAAGNFGLSSTASVPTIGFYQLDGWQGNWKTAKLKPVSGTLTSAATVKLSGLSIGLHTLYFYAALGDVGTVQAGLPSGNSVGNSAAISPVGSVTFTVEK